MKHAINLLARASHCALLALACVATTPALAQSDANTAVNARFQEKFPGVPVQSVTRTPYGLYEVLVAGEIVYTNEDVSYVLQGTLIDTATRTNVTSARMEQISAVPFEQLPLELAFKQVRGNGERKVAIFEDPNCGYCKQLRHTLQQVDDVTIYTFMYPILSPDSTEKVKAIWCADDKGATWDAWMLKGQAPAPAQCDVPVDQLVALGRGLNVRGTPTIIFANGNRVSGALPLAQLENRLNSAQ